ncbi:MAG: TonB family protein [Bacteroidales bacterium]|nr:TonB family protein [Bacteroidales bacterium]
MIRTILAMALLYAATAASAQSLEASLRSHIGQICSPALEGRKAGTPGEKKAAGYLYDQLEKMGVTMLTSREGDTFSIITAQGDTIASRNIVGIIEGCDEKLRDEYIVVGAHFDHLGYYMVNVDGVPQRRIYPGADANASGVAVLTEVARILTEESDALDRSVIVAGFGAMEEEFAGSRYFATEGGFSHIADVKMMVNLDMLGRGGSANPFEIYTAIEPKTINALTGYVLEHESVTARPAIHNGMVFPSDNLAFKQAGIPNLTFSTGISGEYRTVRDTPGLLQYDNMAAEAVYIAAFVKALCSKENLGAKDDAAEGRVYSMSECDTPPEFFRGPARGFLDKWVYKYLKYPQTAVADGIEGFEKVTDKDGNVSYKAVVHVSFIVEADGSVSNVKIERSFRESFDSEALRVVSASPKWKAGMVDGKKVRTKITIPVEFRLRKR